MTEKKAPRSKVKAISATGFNTPAPKEGTTLGALLGLGAGSLAHALVHAATCPTARLALEENKDVPAVGYSHLLYSNQLYSEVGASRRLLHDMSHVVEGAVQLAGAIDASQMSVLTHDQSISQAVALLDESTVIEVPAYGGIILAASQIKATIDSICKSHQLMARAACEDYEAPPSSPHCGNVSWALLWSTHDLLFCLNERIKRLFEAGAVSPKTFNNCTHLVEMFIKDIIIDPSHLDAVEPRAVQHNINMGFACAALRLHNIICDAVALDMATMTYVSLADDFPVIGKDWTCENDAD